ncbi:MAG: acylpyruvate hydrolase [Verrucomicrobiales bacterium]|jgi:acylpyruvate hydrolase
MQIGTIRRNGSTSAVRRDGGDVVLLDFADVGELLRADAMSSVASHEGERLDANSVEWAPIVTMPNKIICVGLNYADHIAETNSVAPSFPNYFAKYSDALIGANDDIHLPPTSVSVKNDWEVELCIVIGSKTRYVSKENALDHVAGFTIMNDFSVRDWQKRSAQFLAGKTFEHASAVGPVMVTPDEIGNGRGLEVKTMVNGVVKQQSNTDHLVFGPAELVADLSNIITLLPGDLIATGTPSGVGAARTPPEWLSEGDDLVMSIPGIGELRNHCIHPS